MVKEKSPTGDSGTQIRDITQIIPEEKLSFLVLQLSSQNPVKRGVQHVTLLKPKPNKVNLTKLTTYVNLTLELTQPKLTKVNLT